MERGSRPHDAGVLIIPALSPRPRTSFTLLVLLAAFGAACEAGPSTFDRAQADPGVAQTIPDSVDARIAPDSAEVSTLAELPAAVQVETAEVSEPSGDSLGPALDDKTSEAGTTDGVRFPHPDHVRGLYVNAWAAGSRLSTGSELAS